MDKFYFTSLRTAQGQKQKTSEIQVGGTKEKLSAPIRQKRGKQVEGKRNCFVPRVSACSTDKETQQ